MDRLFLTIISLSLLPFYVVAFHELKPDPNLAWMSTTLNLNNSPNRALIMQCKNGLRWTSSTRMQDNPVWGVDLGVSSYVDKVFVTVAKGRHHRFSKAYAFAVDSKQLLQNKIDSSKSCAYFNGPAKSLEIVVFDCKGVGRFFAIALLKKKTILRLCDVTIYGVKGILRSSIEIPLILASASQSSTSFIAANAIDGIKSSKSETLVTYWSWWQVDLGTQTLVSFLTVRNADSSQGVLIVTMTNDQVQFRFCTSVLKLVPLKIYKLFCGAYGQILRLEIAAHGKKTSLALFEVKLFGYVRIPLNSRMAWISSQFKTYDASKAVTESCKDNGNSFATATKKEYFPSWAIDLQEFYFVDSILATAREGLKQSVEKFANVFALALNYKPKLHSKIKVSGSCAHFKGPAIQHEKVNFRCRKVGRFIALVVAWTTSLELCHIQMFGYPNIISLKGENAWQSSTRKDFIAGNAVDKKCIHEANPKIKYESSTKKEKSPMWAIDLQKFYYVATIVVNVRRGRKAKHFKNAVALVMSRKPKLEHGIKFKMERTCGEYKGPASGSEQVVFSCSEQLGRFVVIALDSANQPLQLCHVSVYENPPH